MIVELLCTPFILFANGIIALMPILTYIPTSIVDTVNLLLKAIQFFPVDVWIIVIGNIVFWVTLHLLIGLIKFVLSFVPFVSMGD